MKLKIIWTQLNNIVQYFALFACFLSLSIASNVNIGNKLSFFKNDSLYLDSNIKYLSNCNDVVIAYKDHENIFKVFKEDGNYLKNTFFKMTLLNNVNYVLQSSNESLSSYIKNIYSDSINEIKDSYKYDDLFYIDTNYKNKLYYNVSNNKFQINFESFRVLDVFNLRYKLLNIDSVKLDIDSNLVVFTKLNEFIIERIKVRQYDSIAVDSVLKPLNFNISNDTISIALYGLDTNKLTSTSYYNNSSSNSYINYSQSEQAYEQSALKIINDPDGNSFILSEQKFPISYTFSNFSSSITTDTLVNIKAFFIEKYDKYNQMIYNNLIGYSSATQSPEFQTIKANTSNEFVLVGHTLNEIKGEIQKVLIDSTNYNNFKSNFFNGFIFKFDSKCKIKYANYLNFSTNNCNVYISDYKKIGYRDFVIGVIDSLYNKDSLYIACDLTKNNNYTAFVMNYKHMLFQNSEFLLVSPNLNNEYIHFSSIDYNYDLIGNIIIGLSGTTNSTSILNDTVWQKSTNNNCNFIFTTNYFIDTISKALKIEGNLNEGKYQSKLDFHKNFTKLFVNDDSHFTHFALTNSNSFTTNNDSLCVKNYKVNNKYNLFVTQIDTNNKINSLLFINSYKDQDLINVKSGNNNYSILLQGYSNDFILPSLRDTIVSDTLTDTLKIHSNFIIINSTLSLTKNLQTNLFEYSPVWLSYFDNNNYESYINDFDLFKNDLNFIGKVKGSTFYSNNNILFNGNNTIDFNDSFKCKVYLGVIY